jgi:hypothetical protein
VAILKVGSDLWAMNLMTREDTRELVDVTFWKPPPASRTPLESGHRKLFESGTSIDELPSFNSSTPAAGAALEGSYAAADTAGKCS